MLDYQRLALGIQIIGRAHAPTQFAFLGFVIQTPFGVLGLDRLGCSFGSKAVTFTIAISK